MGHTASAHLTQFGSATVDIGVLFTLTNFKIRMTGWNFVGTQVLASDNGTTFTQIALLASYQHDTDYFFTIAPMAVRYIRFNDLNNFTPGPSPSYDVTFTEIVSPTIILAQPSNKILLNSGNNHILTEN
jgi:hypothetical protein